jgi:hypothetical protein
MPHITIQFNLVAESQYRLSCPRTCAVKALPRIPGALCDRRAGINNAGWCQFSSMSAHPLTARVLLRLSATTPLLAMRVSGDLHKVLHSERTTTSTLSQKPPLTFEQTFNAIAQQHHRSRVRHHPRTLVLAISKLRKHTHVERMSARRHHLALGPHIAPAPVSCTDAYSIAIRHKAGLEQFVAALYAMSIRGE